MSKSIFISIASYCDTLLLYTIKRALATAKNPHMIHFGVVDQNNNCISIINPSETLPSRISYIHLDALYARGPCWARSLVMSLYNDEDYFFQIDAHTDFCQHWDEYLISQAEGLSIHNRNYCLTAYPQSFYIKNGEVVYDDIFKNPLVHVVKRNSTFHVDNYTLSFEAHMSVYDRPVKGFHIAAGCLFAPGHIVYDLPYDPYYYFHGEEQAYAIRLFTKGWDIYHIPKLPIYHQYNTFESGAPIRPLHWDHKTDSVRNTKWFTLEKHSQERLSSLINNKDLGIYGLGKIQSLDDYICFSGIDYLNKEILPKAYRADR